MGRFIYFFRDFMYQGFKDYPAIDEEFRRHEDDVKRLAKTIGVNEIILYAIFVYDEQNALISADLMLVRMDYPVYFELCGKLSERCRPFIIRGGQEAIK